MNLNENKAPQRIGLFGGTFNPIHLGHTYIAQRAVVELELDNMIFLPCRVSPHKQDQHATNVENRATMCKIAIEQLAWASMHDFDLTAPTPNYSWRTAEHFKFLYPNSQLFWLMGTDQWNSLHQWNQPDRLAENVSFIIFTRGLEKLTDREYTHFVIRGNHPASSTAIRNRHNNGAPQHQAWLHPAVADYIKKHNIYPPSK